MPAPLRGDYILSPCAMAARGLTWIMTRNQQRPTCLPCCSRDRLSLSDTIAIGLIVVFLPDDPFWLLFTLRRAAELLEQSTEPLPMLILSRSPASWLWQTLFYQVASRSRLAEVRYVAADLPCRKLSVLLNRSLQDYPSLEQLAAQEEMVCGKRASGVSRMELNTLLDWLGGDSINSQAQQRGLSCKTLYAQRSSGLKKMVEHHPHMAILFPGWSEKRTKNTGHRRVNRPGNPGD